MADDANEIEWSAAIFLGVDAAPLLELSFAVWVACAYIQLGTSFCRPLSRGRWRPIMSGAACVGSTTNRERRVMWSPCSVVMTLKSVPALLRPTHGWGRRWL